MSTLSKSTLLLATLFVINLSQLTLASEVAQAARSDLSIAYPYPYPTQQNPKYLDTIREQFVRHGLYPEQMVAYDLNNMKNLETENLALAESQAEFFAIRTISGQVKERFQNIMNGQIVALEEHSQYNRLSHYMLLAKDVRDSRRLLWALYNINNSRLYIVVFYNHDHIEAENLLHALIPMIGNEL